MAQDEARPALGGNDKDGGVEPRHTSQGAPTDAVHQEAGDGALTGSVPAGLTSEERAKRSRDTGRDDPGTD